MGEFAKNKISEVLNSLNSEEIFSQQNQDEIRWFIQTIGEPLIRNSLQELYNKKFIKAHDEVDLIDHEIQKLQQMKDDILRKGG